MGETLFNHRSSTESFEEVCLGIDEVDVTKVVGEIAPSCFCCNVNIIEAAGS